MVREASSQIEAQAAAKGRITEVIEGHDTFVLTTHREPDGDGLGAEAALYEALVLMGKTVSIVNNDPLPKQFAFLPHREKFKTYDGADANAAITEADALIIVDAAHPDRTGRMEESLTSFAGTTVVIDHHQVSGWAQVDFIDPHAGAAAELVLDLIESLPVELTPSMADALYAGLATDTQNFTTPNTTADAHGRAARLVEAGADVGRIQQELSATWELRRLRLLGDFLSGLRLAANGLLVWGVVTLSDLERHSADQSDIEGFVDHLLTIGGVRAAVMFVEERDGGYRLSMRSRPGLRVSDLAGALGGGGHALAAGARVRAERAEAMMDVLREFGAEPSA